ncbi:SAF domain-containing protein [Nocardia callitridis]|uniref:SAF domain-containing protein n=1 Tax=Nocardia callitridis TaxID=648753 RepID=A0ABP9JVA7_9NOCA
MTRTFADLGRGTSLRFSAWNRPAWADNLLARRVLAGALVAVAAVLTLRGDPDAAQTPVLVAAHDLAPGHPLTAEDVRSTPHGSTTLPANVFTDATTLVGATAAGAMRAGEVFTDLRVVGPRLAAAAAGTEDARIVPIRLADNAVADILRQGDRVDVIGAEEQQGLQSRPGRTLATDAAVILVSGAETGGRAQERVVLVAMDAGHAASVAAASLRTALTVVFH